jgi:hypothetical protein
MNLENQLKELSKTLAGPYLRPFAPSANWNSSRCTLPENDAWGNEITAQLSCILAVN